MDRPKRRRAAAKAAVERPRRLTAWVTAGTYTLAAQVARGRGLTLAAFVQWSLDETTRGCYFVDPRAGTGNPGENPAVLPIARPEAPAGEGSEQGGKGAA